MFETLKQTASSIVAAFQANPLLFSTIFGVGLCLIWFKYWLMGRAMQSTLKQNYAGWTKGASRSTRTHPTGVGHQDVLVMKPVKVLPIAILCIVFFGGSALFMAETRLSRPDASLKDWFAVVSGAGFSVLGLWLIAFSFTRIIFNGETIERRTLFRRPLVLPMSDLLGFRPISKTIAGGVFLDFKGGQKLRVPARMSGYRQLLDQLAQGNPKLALILRMLESSMKDRKHA